MKRRAQAALLAGTLLLAGCSGPKPETLDDDGKAVRAVLSLLASDGKPVCVQRLTFGSPLVQFRVARRGEIDRFYALQWYQPLPFRPPAMPTQAELRQDVAEGRRAGLPDPPARTDALPREQRTELDGLAFAVSPPAIQPHSVVIRDSWAPAGVHPRWTPAWEGSGDCDAQYVISAVKRNDRAAFVAVRVHHWGTLYALAPEGRDWKVIAQWGNWLY